MKYYYPLFRISFKKEKERKTISTACKDVMLMGMWSASDTLESNWHILRKWNIQIPLLLVYPREVESDVLETCMWIFTLFGSWSPKTGNNPDVLGKQVRYNIVNIKVHWGWGEKIKYKLLLNIFF